MAAHAVVVEQTMPVTELDALGDRVHRYLMLVRLKPDATTA
jgi:hypothetical protein